MEVYHVAIVPLIVGVVELLKGIGLPSKFSALVAALFGILIGIIYLYPKDIPRGIITGLSFGLMASGLYSGSKNTAQGIKSLSMKRKR